jgi:ABC-type transporter Mla subunit MlaD
MRIYPVNVGASEGPNMTHVLKENLEHASSLFVDETRDTLYTTTTRETANSRLCDTLDVVAKNFPVALRTTLSETFSTLDGNAKWLGRTVFH